MIIFYLMIALFLSCASQGTPGGGPVDNNAPELVDYEIKKNRFGNQIIVKFDEVIKPNSVDKAIKVNQSTNFRYKVIYDKIIISDFMDDNGVIELFISRDLSDFQDNKLEKPINLYFSDKQTFFNNEISGKLINVNEKLIYEVALFKITNQTKSFIKKTQSDVDGYFIFNHLDFGEYRLYAVEGDFVDFENDFRRFRYGIQSDELIITENQKKINMDILISDPLIKKEIIRVEMIDNDNAEVIFKDGSQSEVFIRDKVDDPNFELGDTISLKLKLENRLEKYTTKPFTFLTNLEKEIFLESNIDTIKVDSIEISKNTENSKDQVYDKKGSLKGTVNYEGDYDVVVRLSSISDSLNYHTIAKSGSFEFKSVRAGKYALDSYELKADDPKNYYSGIWFPFEKSARFVIYPNEIEIRSRWLIEGIEVNYN